MLAIAPTSRDPISSGAAITVWIELRWYCAERLRALVEDREPPPRDVEQRDRPLEHRLQQLVELQLAGEIGQRIEQRPLLGEPVALGGQEARAADRDAGLIGRGGEDLEIPLLERLTAGALDRQLADRALVDAQRQAQLRA